MLAAGFLYERSRWGPSYDEGFVLFSLKAAVTFGVIASVGLALQASHNRAMQRWRNARAEWAHSNPHAAPIWLYLRPFGLPLKVANPKSTNIAISPSYGEPKNWDFEALLEQVATKQSEKIVFLAVGGFDDSIGAGKVSVDDEWKPHVTRLMRESRLVFVVLGFSDGILWEIQTVLREKLHFQGRLSNSA